MTTAKNLLFSLEEYESRLANVRAAMRERHVDLLIVDQTEFLFYISGFGNSENIYRACLVPLEGEPVFMLRAMDKLPFLETTWLTEYVGFSDWEDPVEVLVSILRQKGWTEKNIGFDGDSYCMTVNRFKRLSSLLPNAHFSDFSGVLGVLRARKSAQEIKYIRRAAEIGDIALKEALAVSGVGKTERDAAAAVHYCLMTHGADSSRSVRVTTGRGDDFLHGNLHSNALSRGDILHMELLPFVNGYSARLMRPAIMGEATPEQRDVAAKLLDIQDRQFEAMRPGVCARDVDELVRKSVLDAALRNSYSNITGYSLGYYAQSSPHTSDFSRMFLPTSEWVLEAGMVFHMYVSAKGIAFSETVLVTDSGAELLTQSPRRLAVV